MKSGLIRRQRRGRRWASLVLRNASATTGGLGLLISPVAHATDYSSTWIDSNFNHTGNWWSPTQWNTTPAYTFYPGFDSVHNNYDVTFTAGNALLDSGITLRTLSLSGKSSISNYGNTNPTLTVNGTLTLNGSNATVYVPTVLNPGAKLNLAGDAATIKGTMTASASTLISLAPGATPYLLLGGNTALIVSPGATFRIDRPLYLKYPGGDDPFVIGPPPKMLQTAGLVDQAPGASINSEWLWTNTGTIRVNAQFVSGALATFSSTGAIDLASAAASMTLAGDQSSLAGQVHIAAGASLTLSSRNFVGLEGAIFDNAGSITVDGKDVLVGHSTTLPGNVTLTTNVASINLYNNAELAIPDANVTLDKFLIVGTGRVTVNHLTAKNLRIDQTSEAFVPASGTFSLPAGGLVSLGGNAGAKLTIGGTASLAGTIDLPFGGRVEFLPDAVVNIPPSATANLRLSGAGNGLLVNRGQFLIDHGSLVSKSGGLFDNSGTVRITGGAQSLDLDSLTNSGVIDVRASATVTLYSDQLSNSGLINLDHSTFLFPLWYSVNTGTIRASAGSSMTLGLSATNSGVIDLRSGSTVTFGGNTANTATGIVTASGTSTTVTFGGANAGLIALDGGATVNFSGFSRIVNSGTITASAANITFSQVAFTNSGTVQLDAGSKMTGSLSDRFGITPNGVLRLTSGSMLNLQVYSNATFAGLIDVDHSTFVIRGLASNPGTIHVAAGGTAYFNSNLTNNGVIELDAGGAAGLTTTLANARAQIRDGHIRASQSASDPAAAVALALASDLGVSNTWRGVTVTSSDIFFFPARFGDANLDGTVDFNDLVKLAQNYNTTDIPARPKYVTWLQGDFTADGVVDFNDLVKLAQNYNTPLPGDPVPGAPALFEADLNRAFSSVPEPSRILWAFLALCAGTRRRRRHE